MIIVVDTNIIISALIKPYSDSSKILNLILSGKLKLAYGFSILNEYEEVLKRKKFGFNTNQIESIIIQIKEEGMNIGFLPLDENLPDEDDLPFVEVAIGSLVDFIVTVNKKHFPKSQYKNIKVLSPAEFLEEYKKEITK